ncbi:hypothetical protein ACVMH6_000843 [Rhizobium leguminosarum]
MSASDKDRYYHDQLTLSRFGERLSGAIAANWRAILLLAQILARLMGPSRWKKGRKLSLR